MFTKKEIAKFSIIIVLILFLLILYLVIDVATQKSRVESIDSFEECARAGYGVLESFPERCITPDGRNFTKEYPEDELEKQIPPREDKKGVKRSPGAYDGCIITGCSGQVCAEEDVATTCEWKEEYACYQDFGVCEEQATGGCGWSDTSDLSVCLESTK